MDTMNQGVGEAYEPPTVTINYEEGFPALPQTNNESSSASLGKWNQKMRIGTSLVTQVFRVPVEEQKYREMSETFGGQGEQSKKCAEISKRTGAHIEISSAKDQSLTFLVTGKHDCVLDARRLILENFQTQAHVTISIPKEHHGHILGKNGKKLQELEKKTATKISISRQDENSDNITVTGPKEGIDKAVHEIQLISAEQSKQGFERLSVPKKYHPFILGGHNERLARMQNEYGVRINIPPPSVQKDDITVSGEKEGVILATAAIQKMHNELATKCTTISVEVRKSQHKYIRGPRGNTISDILNDTGVSVELPSGDTPSDTVVLRGPQEKLGTALTIVYAKASSVIINEVKAPVWMHKFIIGRKGANIKQITQDLPKVHVEFSDNADRISLEGPPEEVEKARDALESLVKDLLSKITFEEVKIDPKYHKHIIGKQGINITRIKNQHSVLINIPENEYSDVIRIEGHPSGVTEAKQELIDMVSKMENEKERDILIDHRFHRNIIGAKGDNIREIRDKFNQVNIGFPDPGDKRDVVKIRGPKEDVDACYKYLSKLQKDLVESNYQVTVPIYKQCHKYVIGKGGVNIKKIREECNAKIDLPAEGSNSENIIITGKKADVEKAKEMIQKIQNELDNIVTLDIIIPQKIHNSIIGAGGKLIQSIMQDCGGVQIKFPNANSNSDKVNIRGPKDDVAKAKQMLVELSEEKQLASCTGEVKARPNHHKFLIGRAGANIKKVRDSTGARIIFPSETDTDKETITIIGTKEQVANAKSQLEALVKDLDNVCEGEMKVDPKYHRHFVARRGEVLRDIAEQFGGVTVSFPRSGVHSDRVVLKGSKECVDGAKKRIQEIVTELENQVTMDCVISQKHHRTVMGAKGSKVQQVQTEFDVQIKFPDRVPGDHVNGEEDDGSIKITDIIRITGQKERCLAAKQALLNLVPVCVEVPVPYDFHRFIIGQKGKDVRVMMETYDVNLSVPPANQHSDIIKITGAPVNVEEAKSALLKRCEELEGEKAERALKSFEVTVEIDAKYHPKIIGRRGAVISKIRDDYDVNIQFPRKEDEDQTLIIVTGYEKNANEARDAILKIVSDLESQTEVEVKIDRRVHSRLIGGRGRAIRKVMDDFKVDIKFPRPDDEDPDVVVITGAEDNVLDARDHLLNMEEEYLQDIVDREYMQQFTSSPRHGGGQPNGSAKEFVVKGGPWEEQAPNTASADDFPSFGVGAGAASTPIVWGPRR